MELEQSGVIETEITPIQKTGGTTDHSQLTNLDYEHSGHTGFAPAGDYVEDANYTHTDNNYTNEEKTKLAGLNNYDDTEIKRDIQSLEDTKVDREVNKGLSTNDYTDAEKTKLVGLSNYDDTEVKGDISSLQSGKADKSTTYTKSEVDNLIPDVSSFITKSVDDLVNYYKKSETYTQAEINSLIGAISTINIEVVETLPTQEISTTTIYLVPKTASQTNNAYDEYIYVSNNWEKIGDTEIDLSDYVKNTDYATSSVGGVIKTNPTYYGTKMYNGALQADTKTYQDYDTNLSNDGFVSKGTLENVITGKGLVSNTDYASTQDAGVIKIGNGTYMNSGNFITATEYTYANYQNAVNGTFIGKATLENVITGKGLVNSTDLATKQDIMQYSTLPTASADNLGKIVQYTGTTTNDYTNGYFYQCVSDGESTPTYSWNNINVQAGGGGVSEGLPTYLVGSPTQTSSVDIPLETLKAGFYKPQYEKMGVYLTKNGQEYFKIYLINDLIVFKDYADAEVGEIFALVPYWDDGSSPRTFYRYIKKTDDSSGYTMDYSKMGSMPNYGNYLFANTYGPVGFNGVVSFNSCPNSQYGPTNDTDLANKKYVDDTNFKTFYNTSGGGYNIDLSQPLTPGIYFNYNDGFYLFLKGLDGITENIDIGFGYFVILKDFSECANGETFIYFHNSSGQRNNIARYINNPSFPGGFARSIEYNNNNWVSKNTVLTRNNSDSYTPSGNYNPSTKLYTDKTHYENMTGYDATKTQVLKNINGTLTWVDE